MAPKEKKTKAQIAAAAAGGGKAKKKKWSKGKQKEKLNHSMTLEQKVFDKMKTDVIKRKLITPAVVSDQFKVGMSVSRAVLKALHESGMIRLVGDYHHSLQIYTRNPSAHVEEDEAVVEKKAGKR